MSLNTPIKVPLTHRSTDYPHHQLGTPIASTLINASALTTSPMPLLLSSADAIAACVHAHAKTSVKHQLEPARHVLCQLVKRGCVSSQLGNVAVVLCSKVRVHAANSVVHVVVQRVWRHVASRRTHCYPLEWPALGELLWVYFFGQVRCKLKNVTGHIIFGVCTAGCWERLLWRDVCSLEGSACAR
jgi:hypothetical protein